jgi:hypothetical protein
MSDDLAEKMLSMSLVRIRRLADHHASLEGALHDEILRAHEAGGSFREIGRAAGVSREKIRRIVLRAES